LVVVRRVRFVDEGKLELKRVNLDLVLSCVVLEDGSQEALSKEEA